jgi:hypothetical protein
MKDSCPSIFFIPLSIFDALFFCEAHYFQANDIQAYDIQANNIQAYDIQAYDIQANIQAHVRAHIKEAKLKRQTIRIKAADVEAHSQAK